MDIYFVHVSETSVLLRRGRVAALCDIDVAARSREFRDQAEPQGGLDGVEVLQNGNAHPVQRAATDVRPESRLKAQLSVLRPQVCRKPSLADIKVVGVRKRSAGNSGHCDLGCGLTALDKPSCLIRQFRG